MAPSLDVARGHEIAHRAQGLVREGFPQVEGVTFHIEPDRPSERRVLVPAEESTGPAARLSRHFGRAPYFVLARIERDEIASVEVRENTLRDRPVRAGLAAINDLLQQTHFDTVIVSEIGEIAYHALRDAFVEVFQAEPGTVQEALDKLLSQQLEPLAAPTHSSEEKLKEARGDDSDRGTREAPEDCG